MKLVVSAVIFSLAMLPTVASSQDSVVTKDYSGNYLCKLTASAGVRLDPTSGNWLPTTFDVSDKAYIVNVIDTGETEKFDEFSSSINRLYNITVKDFEGDGKARPCFNGRQTPRTDKRKIDIATGPASCVFFGTEYRFNFETRKLQTIFDGGYMDTEPNTDTPYVAVGTCQRIN